MKNYFLKMLCCCLLCQVASGQSPQQLFDAANRLYQQQQYDTAAKAYQRLIDIGYENAALYYNAGNANYKANHTGNAVYDFEKALQQEPGNPVIQYNLQLANQRITDKPEQIPTLFFVSWWKNILHFHRPNGWLAGSIIFFWLLLLSVGWRYLTVAKPRWTKWGMYIAGILFAFYFIGTIASFQQVTQHPYGIVMDNTVKVKSAPDSGSGDITEIHEGVKVKVLDTAIGWKKIRLSDGKEGWIPANGMKEL